MVVTHNRTFRVSIHIHYAYFSKILSPKAFTCRMVSHSGSRAVCCRPGLACDSSHVLLVLNYNYICLFDFETKANKTRGSYGKVHEAEVHL